MNTHIKPEQLDVPGVLEALSEQQLDRSVLSAAFKFRGAAQEQLFALAREQRDRFFPAHEVEVRSVIEISNKCTQRCNFCNMGALPAAKHYMISLEEVMHLTDHIYQHGRRVIMLQSGEWPAQKFLTHVETCVRAMKSRYTDLEIILCLGNLKKEQYLRLRGAGATRYILKFETSNPDLYHQLKPHDTLEQRLACLETLVDLGFKVGSGNMVGFPGQTIDDLVEDLLLLGKHRLYMASSSVFIPGEQSRLGGQQMGDIDHCLNMMALIRILYPDHLIPTTSALERARHDGQYLGLMAGANTVTIHDGTPEHLKDAFPIYSVLRFAPTTKHLETITTRAGLRFATKPLQAAPLTLHKDIYANAYRCQPGLA
jgi:biotin synthase